MEHQKVNAKNKERNKQKTMTGVLEYVKGTQKPTERVPNSQS